MSISRRRDRNLTVTNPLRVKVAMSGITLPSFTPVDLVHSNRQNRLLAKSHAF
jgi:hypothetical protein